MRYDVVKTWHKCSDGLPDDGVLCVVVMPLGEEVGKNRCAGPSATAYYRHAEGRWVYADTPSPLRFDPYYWWPFDELRPTCGAVDMEDAMSQRLHIGDTEELIYDCVLDTPDGARDKLMAEWLMCGGGVYIGPWKISIANIPLWEKVEPVVAEVLTAAGWMYPDDVSAFYVRDESIEHPTAEELRVWLGREVSS